ncbi:hypothetical protein DPSP01_007687 [Paraphaeosphaeria sporulosa]
MRILGHRLTPMRRQQDFPMCYARRDLRGYEPARSVEKERRPWEWVRNMPRYTVVRWRGMVLMREGGSARDVCVAYKICMSSQHGFLLQLQLLSASIPFVLFQTHSFLHSLVTFIP